MFEAVFTFLQHLDRYRRGFYHCSVLVKRICLYLCDSGAYRNKLVAHNAHYLGVRGGEGEKLAPLRAGIYLGRERVHLVGRKRNGVLLKIEIGKFIRKSYVVDSLVGFSGCKVRNNF